MPPGLHRVAAVVERSRESGLLAGRCLSGPVAGQSLDDQRGDVVAAGAFEGGVDQANTETSKAAFKRQFPETIAALRANDRAALAA